MSASRYWIVTMIELPGVGEDGMSGRNVQRKLGTTRGSPRRSRTAKASRISRPAVKSRCAREWGGWGRLSDDGPGQHNPDPSEGPWGRAAGAARTEVPYPTTGMNVEDERACAAMLADIPVGESPIGGGAQLPP